MIYLAYRLHSSSLREIKTGTQCRNRSIDHKGTLLIGLLSLTAHLAFLYSPGQGTLGSMVNSGMDLHTSTNNEENVPQTSTYSSMIKAMTQLRLPLPGCIKLKTTMYTPPQCTQWVLVILTPISLISPSILLKPFFELLFPHSVLRC